MKARTRNTNTWIRYFHDNERRLLSIFWNDEESLTASEFETVAASVRIFQLGENSEGKHLLELTKTFGVCKGDPLLEDCMKRFIEEEQRHAGYLARFMQIMGIPLATKHWTDRVFRTLRHFWNLEISLAVLLTAELVARVYYRALISATKSTLLKQICRQLLRDEVMHVYFHTDLLRSMRPGRSTLANFLWNLSYRFFHSGTLLAVWVGHARVLQAGGFPFKRFWRCSKEYREHAISLLTCGAGVSAHGPVAIEAHPTKQSGFLTVLRKTLLLPF